MRSLLILTLFMILTSCGQENISNTIEDTSKEVVQENQLDNNEIGIVINKINPILFLLESYLFNFAGRVNRTL